jgi:hypothetical protein
MDNILTSELLWSALATVFGISVGTAMLALSAKYAAGWSREAWERARGYLPSAIEIVNDPEDAMVVWMDRYVPGQAADIISKAFPAFLRAAADELDKVLLGDAPAQEVNVGGAV